MISFKSQSLNFKNFIVLILIWTLSSILATLLRFDGSLPIEKIYQVLGFGIVGGLGSVTINQIFFINISLNRRATIEEVFAITVSTSIITFIFTVFRILFSVPSLPRSIPILTGLISLILQFTFRLIYSRNSYLSLFTKSAGENTLIYGAGISGRQLAEQMLVKADKYKPVGFLDDDVEKRNLRIFGRRVMGTVDNLEDLVEKLEVKILVVAFSGVSPIKLLDLEKRCRNLDLDLKIIPSPYETISKDLNIVDLTNVTEEDLLGRRPVIPDETKIASFLQGKKILITGAGGSIGSEISRQVYRFVPNDLFLLDRDENSLLSLQLALSGDGLLANQNLILADIRDHGQIEKVISKIKPDVIFHAAALKHLALLEKFPDEALKTNVQGTKNLLQSSLRNAVKYFVNISTDKAADPISELGRSKLITEQYIAGISDADKKYISVRFGNVIGSNGSFLNTFRHQIKTGNTIKVTHPDVTRYFMTVSEAVHLVLQSVIVGKSGETLILDMGDPVKITTVAQRMIEVSGNKIKIEYTGLRQGEKLNEVLVGANEKVIRGAHPSIMHTRVATGSEVLG